MLAEEFTFLRRDRFRAGRAGDDGAVVFKLAELRPELFQRRRHVAGLLAVRQVGDDVGQARIGFRAAGLCMRLRLDDEESAGGAKREAGVVLPSPDRSELVPEVEIIEFIENQQVLALAVLRAPDQRDVALTGRDACERDPRCVDAGSFLAHEGARRAGHAVHDGDVAGEQV